MYMYYVVCAYYNVCYVVCAYYNVYVGYYMYVLCAYYNVYVLCGVCIL